MVSSSTSQDVSAYEEMTQYEHVIHRSDMYIGSSTPVTREEYLLTNYMDDDPRMTLGDITIADSVIRCFMEALSNASDNVERSRAAKIATGEIRVEMFEDGLISIQNNGKGIPIAKKRPLDKLYISEMIFGQLLTSSNYKNDTSSMAMGGKFGCGIKLCNIFSNFFEVEICNKDQSLRMVQRWGNMMLDKSEPVIEKWSGPANIVKVSYRLNFEKFNIKGYPSETEALFAQYAANTALACEVPVYFNNFRLPFERIEDYARLNWGIEEGEYLVASAKPGYDPKMPMSSFKLLVAYTPDEGHYLGLVNGLLTTQGGVHVTAVQKALGAPIVQAMGKKGEARLTTNDVSPHFSIIICAKLPNPEFTGQSKNVLSSPTPHIVFTQIFIKSLLGMGVLERLASTLDEKSRRKGKQKDGKKKRHIIITKGYDANEAGGLHSAKCVFTFDEGESADAYETSKRSLMENGNDYHGSYPVVGKFINTMPFRDQMYSERLDANAEYRDIKLMLGLQEGVDYALPENREGLRYGTIVLSNDPDDDGKHIDGLETVMFLTRFPGLIKAMMLHIKYIPIRRAIKGAQQLSFLSHSEFEDWKVATPNWKKYTIKYFKGLGTSTRKDILEDIKNPWLVALTYDDTGLDLASAIKVFDKSKSKARKDWILQASRNGLQSLNVRHTRQMSVSTFMDKEMIHFSIASLIRAIPKRSDGLKDCQRQLIWSALTKWSLCNNPLNGYQSAGKRKPIKVAQFAGYSSNLTAFEHNEEINARTLITMSQDFPGARNLPFFEPVGQFGTRHAGGKDAASPRYLFTNLGWWLPYIYKSIDAPFYIQRETEGQKVEPESFFPVIPTVLINGCLGIATGWSTFIPNHNPLDVAKALLDMLQNEEPEPLVPWYRGFKGEIRVIHRTKNDDLGDTTVDQEPLDMLETDDLGAINNNRVMINSATRIVMLTKGKYREHNSNIYIDELPLGTWTNDYTKFVQHLEQNNYIRDYRFTGREEPDGVMSAKFELQNVRALPACHLRLTRSYGLNNMVMLDEVGMPIHYKNATDILKESYRARLPIYAKRKAYYAEDFQTKLDIYHNKRRIIELLGTGEVVVTGKKTQQVMAELTAKGVKDPSKFKHMGFRQLTQEALDTDRKHEQMITRKRDFYIQVTPERLWIIDIVEFVMAYCEHYNEAKPSWLPDASEIGNIHELYVEEVDEETDDVTMDHDDT